MRPRLKAVKKNQAGQAVLEYVLLTVLMTGVFGFFFNTVRKQVLKMWVCDIGLQVQGASGCTNPQNCLDTMIENSPSKSAIAQTCR